MFCRFIWRVSLSKWLNAATLCSKFKKTGWASAGRTNLARLSNVSITKITIKDPHYNTYRWFLLHSAEFNPEIRSMWTQMWTYFCVLTIQCLNMGWVRYPPCLWPVYLSSTCLAMSQRVETEFSQVWNCSRSFYQCVPYFQMKYRCQQEILPKEQENNSLSMNY